MLKICGNLRNLRMPSPFLDLCLGLVCCFAVSAQAEVRVSDDMGEAVALAQPARRIVSLAPHATELLFAAGAGGYVVGAAEYSDYPPKAGEIPRVGGAQGLDLEAIVALRPDLVVAWPSGNPAHQIERLRRLGVAVYASEPRRIEDVADSVERLGRLAGTEAQATRAAAEFRRRHARLHARRYTGAPLRVFYQILDEALITVNGRHLISDVIRLCGGENVFADLALAAARIDIEAVVRLDPDVIVAGGEDPLWRAWRARWGRWPALRAVRKSDLYLIPPDAIHRLGPRILDGAEQVCAALDQARKNTDSSRNHVGKNRTGSATGPDKSRSETHLKRGPDSPGSHP